MILIKMRFYRKTLPLKDDIVLVSIVDNNFDTGFVKVNLLEYDNMEGNIIHTNISKKIKIVGKFLKTKKNKIFPCQVYEIDGEIPSLTIVNDKNDHDNAIRNYELYKEIYNLVEDFIFTNSSLDKEIFYENFLWNLTEDKNRENNYFNDYLEDPTNLKKYMDFDEETIHKLLLQFTNRIEYSNIVYATDINITILSDNSLYHLNTLIDNISEYCNSIHYNGAPQYKLTFKEQTEALCKDKLNMTMEHLNNYCCENNVKGIIKIVPESSKIQSKTIRLRSVGRNRHV